MKYYITTEDNYVHVHIPMMKCGVPSSYEIGYYEIDGDGCYVFTANDTGDMVFFGHTLTKKSALNIIKRVDRLIARYCR